MNAAHMVIWAMLPVIIVFLLGFFAAKIHDFDKEKAEALNVLVMRYTLPLTLFVGTVETSRSVILADMPLLFSFLFVFGALYFLVYLLCRVVLKMDMSMSALFALTATVPGVPFIGPSVLQYMFGTDGIVAVSISSLIINVVAVPASIIFLTIAQGAKKTLSATQSIPQNSAADELETIFKVEQDRRSKIKVFTNQILSAVKVPVVWLPALGFILVLAGVKIPKLLDNSFGLLGVATGGVSLFASGIVLALFPVRINKFVISTVVFKNIIQPAILWGILIWIGAAKDMINEAVITTAIPTVSLSVMIAMRFNTEQGDTASAALFSTLLSVLTMGIFVYLLGV